MKRTAQQLALAAALAAGPACGDADPGTNAEEAERPPEEPENRAMAEPEPEPEAMAITLQNGFLPDPLVVEGTTGGQLHALSLGEDCTGYYDPEAGHQVTAEGVFAELRLLVTGVSDAGILVVGANSTHICSSTTVLQSDLNEGDYRVHVTAANPDTSLGYRLAFTELVDVTSERVESAELFAPSPRSASAHVAP